MKRFYRQYREPYRVPIEVIDVWLILLFVFGLFVYLAWRYV
jgi:hypothetical protein